jgi:hypothetical protein
MDGTDDDMQQRYDSGDAPRGGRPSPASIRAGGASSDDDVDGFEEYEYGRDYYDSTSSRGRRVGKRGHKEDAQWIDPGRPIPRTSARGWWDYGSTSPWRWWLSWSCHGPSIIGLDGKPKGAYEDNKIIDDDDDDYDGLPECKSSKEGAGASLAEDAADAADDVTEGGPDDSSKSEEDSSSSTHQKEADEWVAQTYPTKADKVVHCYDNRASIQPHVGDDRSPLKNNLLISPDH